jgi:hypothetical protein
MTIGCIALVQAGDLEIRSAANMGPGYFPTALGGILCVLGLIILLGGMFGQSEVWKAGSMRPYFVILGILAFAGPLAAGSFWVALIALVTISAFATRQSRWPEVLLFLVFIIAFSGVLFVWALNLTLPKWPF